MIIIHVINNLEIGGAETQLVKLVSNDLNNKNIILNLIGRNSFISDLKKKNIEIINFNFKSKNPLVFCINFYLFLKTIKQYKPSVIVFWLYHSFIFSIFIKFLFKKIKIYWNIRQVIPNFKFEKKLTKFIYLICKFFSRLPDGLIFNSKESLSMHKKNNFINKNTFYIPNGFEFIDNKITFQDRYFEEKIKKKKVISLIARYHSSKGHMIFFNAALKLLKKHKELIFFIAGKNLSKEKIFINKINEYDLSNHFYILDEINNVDYYLKLSDILVNCSISSEGFPNIIGEGIINDCICISSGIGDSKIILNNNKFLFFENNEEMLQKKIISILELDSNKILEIKSNTKLFFKSHYSILNTVNMYNKIYNI